MGAEAKRYLQDHSIPQLFESLMTGLIYNKPEDPITFLEAAIGRLRVDPDLALKWDSFVEFCPDPTALSSAIAGNNNNNITTTNSNNNHKMEENKPPDRTKKAKPRVNGHQPANNNNAHSTTKESLAERKMSQKSLGAVNASIITAAEKAKKRSGGASLPNGHATNGGAAASTTTTRRQGSVARAADAAQIAADAPIILFMGGPGGGKTRYAARVRDAMAADGLVHICMPDLIRHAIARYRATDSEWRDAAERYQRGELIPNHLAQDLVKAEMGRHPDAKAYFLEGFPREARQVEDFERNVRRVNLAMILDYDEDTLRRHMEARGLLHDVIDRRIHEFRQKTLPSAKYFDDQRLLHLIPGEKDADVIFERMRKLVTRAMAAGVFASPAPIAVSTSNSSGSIDITGTVADTPKKQQIESRKSMLGSGGGDRHAPPQHAEESGPTPQASTALSDNVAVAAASQNGNEASSAASVQSTPSPVVMSPDVTVAATANSSTKTGGGSPSSQPSTATRPRLMPRENAPQYARTVSVSPVGSARSTPTAAAATTAITPTADSENTPPVNSSPPGNEAVVAETERSPLADNAEPVADALSNTENSEAEKLFSPPTSAAGSETEKEVAGVNESTADSAPVTENASPQPSMVDASSQPAATTDANVPLYDRFPKGLPSNAPVILVIGAPGSQKAALARRIAAKYDGYAHFSMGQLFRRRVAANADDELWSRVGRKMYAGELIPMKICRELLYSTIHESGSKACWGYVIEGYPRTLPQAEDIEAQLGRLDVAVLIDCTEQFCRDTIRRRRERALDNEDDDPEAMRRDDDEASVRNRLALFKQNTLPMLKYLDDKGKLRVIEGDTNLDKVFQDIIDVIDQTVYVDANNNNDAETNSNSNYKSNEQQ